MSDTVIIDDLGIERFLGNIPQPQGLCRVWPTFGDGATQGKMIPRSKWEEVVAGLPGGWRDPYLPPVANQGNIGMCNASATCTAIEACRLQVGGLKHIQLSGGDLYGRINGGVDRGSLLEDGLAEAIRSGVAPVSVVPYLDWRSRNQEAIAARRYFRVDEAWLCPTFEHCFSAVACGFKLITGIMWHSNYRPMNDGWLPRGSGNAGGHAIFGYKPAMRHVGSRTEFGVWHQNSWGDSWGLEGGKFVIAEGQYAGPVGGWWAVRSVVISEADPIPAPK